mgnify:CR=1 FL=1
MKKFLLALTLAAAGLCAVSCYNDSAVWDEIETLKSRMAALEKAYSELTDYKTIMQNMEAVKSIVQNADGSYTINFFNADPITIANGSAGVAGKDGATPSFKIDNGQWYVSYDDGATWTLIGEAAGNWACGCCDQCRELQSTLHQASTEERHAAQQKLHKAPSKTAARQ